MRPSQGKVCQRCSGVIRPEQPMDSVSLAVIGAPVRYFHVDTRDCVMEKGKFRRATSLFAPVRGG